MKHLLKILLLSLPAIAFGQTNSTTQTTQVDNTIRGKVYSPTSAADMFQALLNAQADGTASGTNTYAVTINGSRLTSYSQITTLLVTFTNANSSTTCTMNVNGIGALSLKNNEGNDLAVGDIKAGGTYICKYTGTNLRVINVGGSGASLPSLDKTSSFEAHISEAGIYHYNITPGSATTITFPDLTGQEGLQWAFWKNADADLVQFDFGAETYNGATVIPDTSWVYVNWSDGQFKVAGSNPSAGFANPMSTTGDIIYGGSGGTATRLGGSTGVLHSNGASAPTWGAVSLTADVSGDLPLTNIAQIGALTVLGNASTSTADVSALSQSSLRDIVFNTRQYDRLYSTFIGGSSEFLTSNGGTGSIVSYSSQGGYEKYNGIVRASTGTTTTGLAFLRSGNLSAIVPANGEIWFDCVVRSDGNLSDGTDTYIVYAGLTNDNAAEPVNGIYFRYTHSVNGGEWQFITRNASTETAVDTNVVFAINTYYRLSFLLNAAGTSVEGFIDGTSIGTITTNIPSAGIGVTNGIRKTAGTTSRNLDMDFIDVIIELSNSK